jgi:hypothetical protein
MIATVHMIMVMPCGCHCHCCAGGRANTGRQLLGTDDKAEGSVPGDVVVLQFPVRLIRGRNLDFPLSTIPTVSRYEKYDDYQNAFTFGSLNSLTAKKAKDGHDLPLFDKLLWC